MYHFQMMGNMPQVASSTARQWHLAPNASLAETFSWYLLGKLHEHGLRPTPFKVFHETPKQANLRCYPWLIVEHKKEKNQLAMTVYCQAANAAARAVQMNEVAAKYAVAMEGSAQIPPVVTITTIGPQVKVWIAYSAANFMAPFPLLYIADYKKWKNCETGYVSRIHMKKSLYPAVPCGSDCDIAHAAYLGGMDDQTR